MKNFFCIQKISFLCALFLVPVSLSANHITIVGCGYVGLTLAGVLLREGHSVICVDTNKEKIAALKQQQLYIFESQLEEVLFDAACSDRISFVDSIEQVEESQIFYLCVPTPIASRGECDCSFLLEAFHEIVDHCTKTNSAKIICIKSTVPPGTMRGLCSFLEQKPSLKIDLVYNPEFMREGCALRDIYTNPIVLGGDSQKAMQSIEHLYRGFLHDATPVIKTTFETAEMIKYSWNAFSAIRIAYVNELALLCRELNADIATVIQGFSLSEQLLPTASLKPGPGFGGSCLPKDTASFAYIMQSYGFESSLLHQAIQSNREHINRVIQDIDVELGVFRSQKIVTLLGLSFKANTNDIRNAPSIAIIKALLEAGVEVHVYDPQAMEGIRQIFTDVRYFNSPYDAVENSDCIVVLTEWNEIKNIDLERVGALCRKKVLIDTRNIFDTAMLKKNDFIYKNMGCL